MSKTVNKLPMKLENKGPGDHRRESSGGRNDRGDKSHSHSHSRSDSGSRSKHLGRDSNSKPVDPANQTAAEDGDKNESKGAEEKKFTGRCRLFVGNLTPDVTEDVFKKMFLTYGEVSEVYVNSSRGFGFIRLVSTKQTNTQTNKKSWKTIFCLSLLTTLRPKGSG